MKTFFSCLPCFVRQTLKAVRMVSDDAALHERVLRRVLRAMSEMRFGGPPKAGPRRSRHGFEGQLTRSQIDARSTGKERRR